MCAICDMGYYKTVQTCADCAGAALSPGLIAFIVVIFLFLVCPFVYFAIKKARESKNGDFKFIEVFLAGASMERALDDEETNIDEIRKQRRRAALVSRGKILFSTYQILVQGPKLINVKLPPTFLKLVQFLDVLSLDIMTLIPIKCFAPDFNYLSKLYVTTLIPLIGFAILYIVCQLNILYLGVTVIDEKQREESVRIVKLRYFSIFLIITSLILPPISTTILNTFYCMNVDPNNEDFNSGVKASSHNLMLQDYSIDCETSAYYVVGRIWTITMLLVYPIGIPYLYYYLLRENRIIIEARHEFALTKTAILIHDKKMNLRKKRMQAIDGLNFIFIAYNPKLWYWEVVEITRRIMLKAGM